jgi:hypothetical protein
MKKIITFLISLVILSCQKGPEGPSEEQQHREKTLRNYSSVENLINEYQSKSTLVEFCEVDSEDGSRKLIDAEMLVSCVYADLKLNKPYVLAKGIPFHSYYWTGYSYDGATKLLKVYYLPQWN